MALRINNAEIEKLAEEVAALCNESKTEAIRRALAERKQRLMAYHMRARKMERLEAFLRKRIWPRIPANLHKALTQLSTSCHVSEHALSAGSNGGTRRY